MLEPSSSTGRAQSPLLDAYSAFSHSASPKTSISLDRPSSELDGIPDISSTSGPTSPGLSKRSPSRPGSYLNPQSSPTPSRRTSGISGGIGQVQGGASLGLRLTSNSLFYEIPMADPLTELIEKHVPPDRRPIRDVGWAMEAEKAKNPDILQELISNNSWRALTRVTRQKITTANPSQITEILNLWYLRLLSLARLRLYQLAQAELDKLGDLDRPELQYEYHPGLYPGKEGSMVPWELRVLWIKLPGWLGEVRISLERCVLHGLVTCKNMAARCLSVSSEDDKAKQDLARWTSREAQIHLLIVNYLVEIQDYSLASAHLTTLQRLHPNDMNLLSGLGRLHLQLGNIDEAKNVFDAVESAVAASTDEGWKDVVQMNKALQFVATGNWEEANKVLLQVVETGRDNIVATNNLAISELYLGNLKQAIVQLERLLAKHPITAGTCEPLVFNLCTLYELRSEGPLERKVALMAELGKWAGDEFSIECLKIV